MIFLKNNSIYFLIIIYTLMSISWLIAGLWPFNFFSKNETFFDSSEKCLSFGVLSSAYLETSSVRNSFLENYRDFIQIDFLIKPSSISTNSIPYILCFSNNQNETIVVGQWKSGILVRLTKSDLITTELWKDSTISFSEKTLISLRYKLDTLFIYIEDNLIDCKKVKIDWSSFFVHGTPLVIGNSDYGDHQWTGDLYNLFIFYECTSAKFSFQNEIKPDTLHSNVFLSFCRNGNRNQSGYHLQILTPHFFSPPYRKTLTPPWKDFHAEFYYFADVFLNLTAFVLLGFFTTPIASYLGFGPRNAVIAALINSLLMSLTIEMLQPFLPSRTSQLSDLFFNTLGGLIGALYYKSLILKNRTI